MRGSSPAPADGVLPEGFFSTTNLPTYVRIGGEWRLPREPRMDSALVLDPAGELWVREGRRVKQGDRVAVGEAEDGREGIYVHAGAFMEEVGSDGEFKFMVSEVSREKPIDYALMARILVDERDSGGYPIWVVRSRARAFARAQRHGLVHPERLRRRAARRQCGRRARHRGVDLRHDARHERRREGDAGRARAAHARDQQGARRGLDRSGRRERHDHATASCTRA